MATDKKRAWDDTRYIPGVALEFFKAAGKPAKVPAGQAFFGENEKARPYLFMRDKMYLLLDGEVSVDDLVEGRDVGSGCPDRRLQSCRGLRGENACGSHEAKYEDAESRANVHADPPLPGANVISP